MFILIKFYLKMTIEDTDVYFGVRLIPTRVLIKKIKGN